MKGYDTSRLDPIAAQAKGHLEIGILERLERLLHQESDALREQFQALFKSDVTQIVDRLRKGASLGDREIALVRALIVGDAEHYTQTENNFKQWEGELKRLADELVRFKNKPVEGENVLRLQAILRDMRMLIPSIKYFLEGQDRVQRFNAMAGDGVDRAEARILADLLERYIRSTDV